jgi:serine/threonine protein kinase
MKSHSIASDWWTVGLLVYEMLVGIPPFFSSEYEDQRRKILTADLKIPPFLLADAADLIRQILQRDPKLRLSDPLKIRAHSWFSDIDWDKLEKLELTPPFAPRIRSSDTGADIDEVDVEIQVENNIFAGFTYNPNH